MSLLSAIADRYRRLRHSKGYGVHSPLAFTLITEALYPPYGYTYYLENDARLASASLAGARRARAIYRLTILLRQRLGDPMRVCLEKGLPDEFTAATLLAGGKRVFSADEADCVIRRPEEAGSATPADSGAGAGVQPPMLGPLILSWSDLEIAVKVPGMAAVSYSLP